jgi:hypothetical protein
VEDGREVGEDEAVEGLVRLFGLLQLSATELAARSETRSKRTLDHLVEP